MNENRLMQQIGAIFGVFMTFFYLGVGLYLLLSPNLYYVDKVLRTLMGATFVFYGTYRAYRTYQKIIEVFFRHDKNEE
jgi:hypothetical protein